MTVTQMFPPDGIESSTLTSERARASFDVDRMAVIFAGSEEAVKIRRFVAEQVAKNPTFDKKVDYRLSKYQRYIRAGEQMKAYFQQIQSEDFKGWTHEQQRAFRAQGGSLAYGNTGIHESMFLPTIRLQASVEQQKLWLPAFEGRAALGTYCQTEIGHGSDVAGLETQAIYDKQREEFEIHTPTIRAAKWWPQGVGRTVTHAVVYARLLLPQLDGAIADHGVKAFLVQLRDLETGVNLPGIRSGDIGPTIGAIAAEQGWVVFDRVRVPRTALLCRYGEVLADGNFVTHGGQGTEKRSYSTMMKIRSEFAFGASTYLSKGATIATRYCATRRQFKKPGASGEDMQVLDYQGVQVRTLPWIAAAYALHFTGTKMMKIYDDTEKRVIQGDTSAVKEMHALSSGLKAACTKIGADGIEELRRACGGHGYLHFSGMVELYGDMMLMFTGEGENYMIIQQLTRWLMKGEFTSGTGWASFLADTDKDDQKCAVLDKAGWLDTKAQLEALQYRARRQVRDITDQVKHMVAGGKSGADAAHGVQWDGIQAAFAVGDALIASAFADAVAAADPSLQPVLQSLCSLFCLDLLERKSADLLMDNYMTSSQAKAMRDQARSLLDVIRPDAIALVDAFGISDNDLNSALGKYDGDVYRHLLDWAEQEPMNEGPAINGWIEHVKPMMENGRRKLKQETGKTLEDCGIVQACKTQMASRL